ncbi:MAG: hypothetical protein ABJH08_08155 [Balneola sp.]
MTELVETELNKLEKQEKVILELGKKMLNGEQFPLDLLASAVLDRSLSLIFGFTSLVRDKNFLAAVHLVRCHLDNLLRFSAAWIVENPHDFANEVISGTRIEKLKDKDGKYLKDWYLRNKLSEEYTWVKNIYTETSGFIHLSNKHIFSSSRLKKGSKNLLEISISKTDNNVSDNSRLEAILGMDEITKTICRYVEGWIWTKNNPGKVP